MIEAISVNKSIKDKYLLKNINLEIRKGDKLGIIGPVGSGKTTLLRVILGIYKISNGTLKKNVKHIGFMPSSKGLYEELSVKENIEAYTGLKILKEKELIYFSKRIGVFDYRDKKVSKLSSGMKQKVALLIAVSMNPDLLVLDEPTANLDIETRINILNFLKEYSKDKTIVITSHNLNDIEEICDKVIFIKDGELQINNSIKEIKNKFSDERVKLIFTENISDEKSKFIKDKINEIVIEKNYILFDEEKVDMYLILDVIKSMDLIIFEIRRESKNLQDIYLDIRKGELRDEEAIE